MIRKQLLLLYTAVVIVISITITLLKLLVDVKNIIVNDTNVQIEYQNQIQQETQRKDEYVIEQASKLNSQINVVTILMILSNIVLLCIYFYTNETKNNTFNLLRGLILLLIVVSVILMFTKLSQTKIYFVMVFVSICMMCHLVIISCLLSTGNKEKPNYWRRQIKIDQGKTYFVKNHNAFYDPKVDYSDVKFWIENEIQRPMYVLQQVVNYVETVNAFENIPTFNIFSTILTNILNKPQESLPSEDRNKTLESFLNEIESIIDLDNSESQILMAKISKYQHVYKLIMDNAFIRYSEYLESVATNSAFNYILFELISELKKGSSSNNNISQIIVNRTSVMEI